MQKKGRRIPIENLNLSIIPLGVPVGSFTDPHLYQSFLFFASLTATSLGAPRHKSLMTARTGPPLALLPVAAAAPSKSKPRKYNGRKSTNWDNSCNKKQSERVRYHLDNRVAVARSLMSGRIHSGPTFLQLQVGPDGTVTVHADVDTRKMLGATEGQKLLQGLFQSMPRPTPESISRRRHETSDERANYSALTVPQGSTDVEVVRVQGHKRPDVADYFLSFKLPGATEMNSRNEAAKPSVHERSKLASYPKLVVLPNVEGQQGEPITAPGEAYFHEGHAEHRVVRNHVNQMQDKRQQEAQGTAGAKRRKKSAPQQHPQYAKLFAIKQRWLRYAPVVGLEQRLEQMRSVVVVYRLE